MRSLTRVKQWESTRVPYSLRALIYSQVMFELAPGLASLSLCDFNQLLMAFFKAPRCVSRPHSHSSTMSILFII